MKRHLTERPPRVSWVAHFNRFGLVAECGEIAAGIDKAGLHTVSAEYIDRAVDSKALGDAAEVDPRRPVGKAHAMAG